jgi:hypothetical protein
MVGIRHNFDQVGALVPLLSDYRTPDLSIAAIYLRRRHLAAKVRLLIDALVASFAGQEWFKASCSTERSSGGIGLAAVELY